MKINAVTVNNYRTLEDLKISFGGYYSAISGKNNAGKTSLIRVLRQMFKDQLRERFYFTRDQEITYQDDRTQWVTGSPDIGFTYEVSITKDSDPGLYQFVEKFYSESLTTDEVILTIEVKLSAKEEKATCKVNGKELDEFASNEVLSKLKTSNLAFVHDSAARDAAAFFGGSGRYVHEMIFTEAERKQLLQEQRKLQNKVKGISKAHKSELSSLLGKLEEKYDVEFSLPEGMYTGTLPFSINLKDKNVDVPLDEWGSGTKNRTHILMSILHARRIQGRDDPNRITPFVMIEEPESFLHPAAQAEFGRVLQVLANELKIQIIVTTHSPYMLSQDAIDSNILLVRKERYGKSRETVQVELDKNNWMAPFSEILGLNNAEFEAWKGVIGTDKGNILLVEGEIDREYLLHINSLHIAGYQLPDDIDIVPYDGKDSLKNPILLKFITQKFKRAFITFDLDARDELLRTMNQIGLVEGTDFMAIGMNKPGQQCIEGLVPASVLSKVHAANTDLVLQLAAQESKDRKSAKSALKKKILTEFKALGSLTASDLKGFESLFKTMRKKLA